jgi:serine protease Do
MKKTNARNSALSLILIVLLLLSTACVLPLDKDNSAAAGALAESDNTSLIYPDWSTRLTENQAPVLPGIADVVAAVKPSVVAIDTETTFQIFRRSFTQQGAGSGWIIDESGIIVTNSHVVAGAKSIIVTLDDGRTIKVDPNAVAIDPVNDLAILKIDAANLPAAKVGDSSALRVGDWLVAIGNPLGLGVSAKEGIVSRLDVSLTVEGQTLDGLIETSAAINPGNSGGPLVNMKGEVIGITSAKIASIGVEGMGYAISINEAIPIIEELILSK